MRTSADAVIIGGGAIGTSILYHLTMQGMRNVVLLEKGALASGSSGDSAAMIRQHYSTDVGMRLVQKSLEIFQNFPDLVGGDPIFTRTGWLFLVPPEAASTFDENMLRLQAIGVDTSTLSLQELADRVPGIRTDGIARVAFEPDSGYADPHGLCRGFSNRAQAEGAEIHLNTPARGIRMTKGKIEAVVTDRGEIQTPLVVNAAGPWAKQIGQWVGIDLPLEISREQDIVLQPPPTAPPLLVTISNMVDRIYFRPEPGGKILSGLGHPKENEPANPDNYAKPADASFIDDVVARLIKRLPALEGIKVVKGWSGSVYDYTGLEYDLGPDSRSGRLLLRGWRKRSQFQACASNRAGNGRTNLYWSGENR